MITTGDRSGNESEPVSVSISPMRSPIFDVLESVRMEGTFGGVRLAWKNETKSALAVTLLKKAGSKWEEINTYYSDADEGRQAARGMDAEEAEFAVFIKDRWENVSDTVTATLTPLFEEQFPVGTSVSLWTGTRHRLTAGSQNHLSKVESGRQDSRSESPEARWSAVSG